MRKEETPLAVYKLLAVLLLLWGCNETLQRHKANNKIESLKQQIVKMQSVSVLDQLKNLQGRVGVEPDGKIGRKTIEAVNKAIAAEQRKQFNKYANRAMLLPERDIKDIEFEDIKPLKGGGK
jgi:murein L,D-transpeptidase YcbB/YkuD